MKGVAAPCPSAMMLCCTTVPRNNRPETTDWHLCNHETKTFLLRYWKNETRYFVLTMKTNAFPPQSEVLSEDTDIVLAALRIGLKLQSAWYPKQCRSLYTDNCTFPDFCLNTTCVVTAAVDDAMVGRCHRHMQRTEESLLTMNILSVRWWHKIKPW